VNVIEIIDTEIADLETAKRVLLRLAGGSVAAEIPKSLPAAGNQSPKALLVELGQVHAQLAEQKRLNVALAERCAGQSELLTKRAAKPGGDS
jgi:hypothetical protein